MLEEVDIVFEEDNQRGKKWGAGAGEAVDVEIYYVDTNTNVCREEESVKNRFEADAKRGGVVSSRRIIEFVRAHRQRGDRLRGVMLYNPLSGSSHTMLQPGDSWIHMQPVQGPATVLVFIDRCQKAQQPQRVQTRRRRRRCATTDAPDANAKKKTTSNRQSLA